MQDFGNFYAEAEGEDKSIEACKEIINKINKSKINIKLATNVIINITGEKTLNYMKLMKLLLI